MSKLAYITHPIFHKHDTGAFHPESAKRLAAIDSHLKQSPVLNKLEILEPNPATIDIVSDIHSRSYVEDVKIAIENGTKVLDHGDTVVCDESFNAALHAVGAAILGIDLLKSEKFEKVFCAVRPPGHHAEYDHAFGFCIFNNIAVAARYAQKINLADKILIVDWDVHHGNGTQHIFERDPSVFYYSIHQYPYYPGSGSAMEIGLDLGSGFTLNRPMKAGSSDEEYLSAMTEDLNNIQKNFKPELILISAGFDAHRDDPLAGMLLTENSFEEMTKLLSKMAWQHCDGKILSILEGGYNLKALASCVESHLEVLLKH